MIDSDTAAPSQDARPVDRFDTRRSRHRWYSFSNIGVLYVWLLVIGFFSIISPNDFPTVATAKSILNDQAITGLVALSILLPLAAGVFDLSVGYTLGLTSILSAQLLGNTTWNPAVIVIICLLVGLGIGIANAIVVVVFNIDSFIGTLATSSLIGALVIIVSGGQTVSSIRLLGGFSDIAHKNVGGITAPVLYVLVVALVIWFILGHTATGRYLYAIGFGPDAARLSGIRTNRLRFITLMCSAFIAGFAGIVLSARVTTGSPTIGPPYLLPAFAAAFVGATQIRPGRFNAWGTVIAVLLIGTGTAGLSLAGTPIWAPSVFVGVVLIIAVGLTKVQGRVKT